MSAGVTCDKCDKLKVYEIDRVSKVYLCSACGKRRSVYLDYILKRTSALCPLTAQEVKAS